MRTFLARSLCSWPCRLSSSRSPPGKIVPLAKVAAPSHHLLQCIDQCVFWPRPLQSLPASGLLIRRPVTCSLQSIVVNGQPKCEARCTQAHNVAVACATIVYSASCQSFTQLSNRSSSFNIIEVGCLSVEGCLRPFVRMLPNNSGINCTNGWQNNQSRLAAGTQLANVS